MTTIGLVIAVGLLGAAPPPVASAGTPSERFGQAGDRYLAGDFVGAASAYQALRQEGFDSPSLELNLGDALVHAGHRGAAIASYLRALRLDPGDGDARLNLDLARAGNVDRLVGVGGPSLLERVAARTSDLAAAVFFAVPWWFLWCFLTGRLLAGRRMRAVLTLAASLSALLACVGGAVLLARDAQGRETLAVVVSPETGVREGTEEALQPTTTLHEGTELRLLELRGSVVRVRLANGLEGWVLVRDLEVV